MKRKDFLRKMRDRRRGGALEERRPETRRRVDWRTLRYDLPGADGAAAADTTPVGEVELLHEGVRLQVTHACWVRGYRRYEVDDGHRAEFQYRPADAGSEAPPGATALQPGARWEPEG